MSTSPTAARPRPHAGASPWVTRVLSHAGFELRNLLRNGEQLLLTLILPALVLVVLARTTLIRLDAGGLAPVDVAAPGVLALAVMSTAFTSQAISTGFDRRAGALRLLATTPLGRTGLLGGKVVGVLAMEVVQVAVLGSLAFVLGWQPVLAGVGPALLAVLLGTACFTSLALLLAGTLRAEAVLAGANLLWLLLVVGGGVLLPATGFTRYLPSGALGEAFRSSLTGAITATTWVSLAVLAGWTVVFAAATARWFRWH
ncbi:ABC transporter permease [Ruania alba]|uniref:ABC-2 type transport system permease protein n=1 Tax=Ruania alba TaxID=648782 RepID=A0A1H5EHZ3_9MICO|nr:ABC transporter permease [Ruania alba]SED90803.1 ABC-2 type transport system permease protein [Ruania alba]